MRATGDTAPFVGLIELLFATAPERLDRVVPTLLRPEHVH